MNMTITYMPSLTFIGFSTWIASGEGFLKCPQFWESAYHARFAHFLSSGIPQTPEEKAVSANRIGTYALCIDDHHAFTYWIAGIYHGGEIPDGFDCYTVPESYWACFSVRGPIPLSLQNTITKIMNEWMPTEGKRMNANSSLCIEYYPDGNTQSEEYTCEIRIPVNHLPKYIT